MKKSHYKNKLHEYSLLFLLLLVFFGGSVLLSQVLRQSPKTGYKGSWEPHYRTPGSQTWKYSIVVVKKECVDGTSLYDHLHQLQPAYIEL